MQPIELVKTLKWIDASVTPPMRESVFSTKLFQNGKNERGESRAAALQASHDWAKAATIWAGNSAAREVLNAFGLSQLFDEKTPVLFAEALFGEDSAPRLHNNYIKLAIPYNNMIAMIPTLEALLVPAILRTEVESEEILSVTIHEELEIPLKVLQHALEHLQSVYNTLSDLYGDQESQLKIISIQSGSPIGVNLKGSGDIVKQFRILMADVWNRVRFKDQDEQIANNNVLMSSLKIMGEIQKRVQSGALTPEEGEKFKRSITRGTLGLLNSHTLPTEIQSIEIVPNDKLLLSFNPKLLEASTPVAIEASGDLHQKKKRHPKQTRTRPLGKS